MIELLQFAPALGLMKPRWSALLRAHAGAGGPLRRSGIAPGLGQRQVRALP